MKKHLYVCCRFKILSSTNGFSLAELMVAVGIISLLVMSASDVFSGWITYKKNTQASVVADQTQLEIAALLTGHSQCLANLGQDGADIKLGETPTESVADFKDSIGKPIIHVGRPIKNGTSLEKWSLVQTAVLEKKEANIKVLADLILNFKNTTSNGALNFNQRTLKIIATTDAQSEIISCNIINDSRSLASAGTEDDSTLARKTLIIDNSINTADPDMENFHYRRKVLYLICTDGDLKLVDRFDRDDVRPKNCSGSGRIIWSYTHVAKPSIGGHSVEIRMPFTSTLPVLVTDECTLHGSSSITEPPGGYEDSNLNYYAVVTGYCPSKDLY